MLFRFLSLRVASTVLVLTTLAACTKKEEVTPPPAATQGMSWTFDGTNATATYINAQISGSNVAISGTVGTNTNMLVYAPKVVGTYPLNGSNNATAVYTTNSPSHSYNATAGTIVISSISATNVTGTFSFTGTESGVNKAITNGKFDVNF